MNRREWLGAGAALWFSGMANLHLRAADEPVASPAKKPLRAGIIGLDTSHVLGFTDLLNNPKPDAPPPSIRVTAAFPGGSPDIPASRDRVVGFTNTLREKHQVEIVESIPQLLERVDVILLESVDGRKHLEQLRPVLAARKPVFIDKPLAASLADAVQIARAVEQSGTPCFSSSALRFCSNVTSLRNSEKVGEIRAAATFSPCATEQHHASLYWYGVHGVEALFALLGPGCESVVRTHTNETDVVTGVWSGGRTGTFTGLRTGKPGYGFTAFGSKGIESTSGFDGYQPMIQALSRFFETGVAPVPLSETVEIFAFMAAADVSQERGGASVRLAEVLKSPPATPN